MDRRSQFAVAFCAWIAAMLSVVGTATLQEPVRNDQESSTPTAADARAVVDTYCVTCHSASRRTAGLSLEGLDIANPAADAAVWERVLVKLHAGSMPPAGARRPDTAGYRLVTTWIEGEIDRAAEARPNPGRTSAVHRLNRTEYQNAVRDLLGVEVDVTSMLPGDETSDAGFDNVGEALSVAPALLERYLSVARKLTRVAVGIAPASQVESYVVPLHLMQEDRLSEDLPLGSRGGIAVRHLVPVDGQYTVRLRLRKNWNDYIMGMGTPHELELRVDDVLIKQFVVGGKAEGRPAPASFTSAERGSAEWEDYVLHADEGLDVRLDLKAGPRLLQAYFIRRTWEPEGIPQPRQAGSVLSNDELYYGHTALDSLSVDGPHVVSGPGDTPSRRRIFDCRPQSTTAESACARQILSKLARRAYRRPVVDADVDALFAFFEQGRRAGGSFDAGVQFALERLLVDPEFLLRVERVPTTAGPGTSYRVDDLALASRLSFFLWSTIPDDELLDAAIKGQLSAADGLEQQVRRMLASPRAAALVDNFASQWLHVRNLATAKADPLLFPEFDDNLRDAFQQETTLFLASTIREDRSVLDLLSADYTFLNERLARHYRIPGIYGNRFRRVTLPDLQQRGGVLAHGGVLMLTSYPDRTSPVLRGKWLLDTVLSAPPPPPPPDVPALPARAPDGKPASVRKRLEEHRKNAACASCHAAIDPAGFALESFDAVGRYRVTDESGAPVDTTGTMLGGETVEGLDGLRRWLLNDPERFVATVAEKLLAYGLGRRLDFYDRPTVRAVVRSAHARDYVWSALVTEIVRSPAFLMRNVDASN